MENKEKVLAEKVSKKDQIVALYMVGINRIDNLATLTGSRPSYVATVLRGEHLLAGYFDLYTTSRRPMNVYSKFFAGRLGFRTPAVAHRSVEHLELLYRQFERTGDRAGQHHTLLMALTMFNRARWSQKVTEATIFRDWLMHQLDSTPADTGLGKDVSELPAKTQHAVRKKVSSKALHRP